MPSEAGFGDRLEHLNDGTAAPPEAPRCTADAYKLNRTDFKLKEIPKVTGIRDARYQVVFKQSVLNKIHEHGKSSPEAEVCGVLIGDVYSDPLAPWAYVEHCIAGNGTVGKQTQVTITSETWTRIHETLEKEYPGKKIVGWYHTHPGFGIFLSGMDLFIQDNFFNQPWQVATVYDPHSNEEGTFIWRGGKSVRESTLVENDTGVEISESGSTSNEVQELARRVKRLERRIDFILTGFLLLVLIGLSAPLIIFALAPDTMKSLQNIHGLIPNHGAPATVPASVPTTDQPKGAPMPAKSANTETSSAYRTISPVDEHGKSATASEESSGGPKILTPRSISIGK